VTLSENFGTAGNSDCVGRPRPIMLRPVNLDEGPIVIAYDGSSAARQAVEAAAKLLPSRKTLVITVWEAALAHAAAAPPPAVTATPVVDPSAGLDADSDLRAFAQRRSDEGAGLARSLGLDAEPIATVDASNVANTIVELAQRRHAAAIVVGSRGLRGIRARLEGSTSKDVVKRAPCPVIVVHDAADND
jgi:nucleotide-binding universal stress UspA family protein